MKLRIRHNLANDQLQKALVALASASGIEQETADALIKAAGCSCAEPTEPRDPATKELYQQFRRLYVEAMADIKRSIENRLRGAGLVKSKRKAVPLTREQIADLLRAIRDRFGLIAGQIQGDYVPDADQLARWQAEGWISPDVTAADFAVASGNRLIKNAFLIGRVAKAVEAGGSFAEVMRQALKLPLLLPDVHAIAIAEQQTANYITALGDDLAKEAGAIIAGRHRDMIRHMAIDFHGQRLQARVLDAEAKQALGMELPQQLVTTWQGFSSELYHAMEDKSRDWDRVAFFEITDAQKQGQAMHLLEEKGPKALVYKMPMPTACPQCKHAYLEEDGTPKIFQLSELVANGMNIDRKAHPVRGGKVLPGGRPDGRDTYLPVAGLMHPFCSCLGPYSLTTYEPWYLQKKNRGNAPVLAKSEPDRQKTICVDFDGVIADYSQGYQGRDVFGPPLPGAAENMAERRKFGWKVIIFTTRPDTPALRAYLAEHGIEYDHINMNPDQPDGANAGKPIADAYLDDRAIRFVDWDQARRDLRRLVKSGGQIYLAGDREDMIKAHIKEHQRRSQSGAVTTVRAHEDSRGHHATSAADHFKESAYGSLRTQGFKSREKLIEMPIDDFLAMAQKDSGDSHKAATVHNVLSHGHQFNDLPFLLTKTDGDTVQVEGHEGRHRARALKAMGYTTMPVVIKDRNIRWSEQATEGRFDYVKVWPTTMRAEDGRGTLPFPISREDAGKDYGDLQKSHIKAHVSHSKNGAIEMVRDHEDSRIKKTPESGKKKVGHLPQLIVNLHKKATTQAEPKNGRHGHPQLTIKPTEAKDGSEGGGKDKDAVKENNQPFKMIKPEQMKKDAGRMKMLAFLDKYVAEQLPQHEHSTIQPKRIIHDFIPLNSLDPSEWDEWDDYKKFSERGVMPGSEKKIDDLAEKAKKWTPLPPVLVEGHKDDRTMRPMVIDGHHRVAAYMAAGNRNKAEAVYNLSTLIEYWHKEQGTPADKKTIYNANLQYKEHLLKKIKM